jgi:hypothetical protein
MFRHLDIFMKLQILCLALAATVFVGCETTTGFAPRSSGYDTVPDGEKAQAAFSGGDGSSMKQAVIITDTASEKTGVRAEYVWLHEHYPGYRLRGQGLRHDGGRSYDEMRITTADGKLRTIFFDITSFFGK